MMSTKKVRTGIKGLDELIGGGFGAGDVIGVMGETGAGKTIFCLQFLYKGATEYREKGLFITVEERLEDIRDYMKSFGWDYEKLENDGNLAIETLVNWRLAEDKKKSEEICMDIIRLVREHNPKRIAIDSISALIIEKDPARVRDFLYSMFIGLVEEEVTVLFAIDRPYPEQKCSIETLLVKGLISLNIREHEGRRLRSMCVVKMRGAKHDMDEHPMEIDDNGITVYPDRIIGSPSPY